MKAVFLDRDGVLNEKIVNGYVTSWSTFKWLPGAIEAVKMLNNQGWRVFIVTNQACVGKQIIDRLTLDHIHNRMMDDLSLHQATITQIYLCPHVQEEECPCRKPRPGMLLQAAQDYNLKLSNCYMVGDSLTDIMAAKEAGSYSVHVAAGAGDKEDKEESNYPRADYRCKTIGEAVLHIIEKEESIA